MIGIRSALVRKEIREILRDRRAIVLSFVLPIFIYPVMFSFTSWLDRVEEEKTEQQASRVAIRGDVEWLREAAAAECTARLRNWMELAPDAQETLRKAADGRLRFNASDRVEPELLRSAVRAATEVLDRALGTTKQMHEHRLQGGIVIAVAGPPQVASKIESDPQSYTLTNGTPEPRALPAPVRIPGEEADG